MPRKKAAGSEAETTGEVKPRVRVTPQNEMPVKPDAPTVVASLNPASQNSNESTVKIAEKPDEFQAPASEASAEVPEVIRLAYLSDLLVTHEIPAERTMDFIALMKKANFHEDPARRINIAMVERTRFFVEVDPKKVLVKDLKMMQKGLRQYIIQVNDAFERFMEEAKRTVQLPAPASALTIESLQEGRNTLDDLLKQFEQTRQYHLSQAKSDKGRKPKAQKPPQPKVAIQKV